MVKKKNTQKSSIKVSEGLKKPRGFTKENAKAMAEKAKQSPNHGKHGPLKTTILIEDAYKAIQQKIIERSMKLIDTQTLLAQGTIKIFCIHSHWEGSGKKKALIRDKAYLVEDDEEIIKIIDYEYGDGDNPNEHDHEDDEFDYFFVVTKDPDNRAIKDQLDRIGLKAPDKLDLTSGGKEIKQITGIEFIREPKKDESTNKV